MKPPTFNSPAQVHRSMASGALSPREAAVRLARVEFDVARLEREIAVAERRMEKATRLMARHTADRDLLLKIIARDTAPALKRTSTNAA